MVKQFIDELNKIYEMELEPVRKHLQSEGFAIYQARKALGVSVYLSYSSPDFGIYFDFSMQTISCRVQTWRQKDLPQVCRWLKDSVLPVFPEVRIDERNLSALVTFFSEDFESSQSTDERVNAFKERTHEVLRKFLPVFVKAHEAMAGV